MESLKLGAEISVDNTEESSTGADYTALKNSFVYTYPFVDFFNLLMSQNIHTRIEVIETKVQSTVNASLGFNWRISVRTPSPPKKMRYLEFFGQQ